MCEQCVPGPIVGRGWVRGYIIVILQSYFQASSKLWSKQAWPMLIGHSRVTVWVDIGADVNVATEGIIQGVRRKDAWAPLALFMLAEHTLVICIE